MIPLLNEPVDDSILRAALARVPPAYTVIAEDDGQALDMMRQGLVFFRRGASQIGFSVEKHDDGELWLHVSVTQRVGKWAFALPSWEDLKRVKHDFIGEDRWAYQVLPANTHYVNKHPYVLHLYARYRGENALPDFTRGTGEI